MMGGSDAGAGSPPESTIASECIDSPQAALGGWDTSSVSFEGGQLSAVGCGLQSISHLRRHIGSEPVTGLDLSANALQSLPGLELFPRLETLVLDNNRLESLAGMPELRALTTLWLNKNSIADLDEVLDTLAAKAPALRYLSLLGNSVCRSPMMGSSKEEAERYRAYVVYRLPSLQLLDAAPVTAAERQLAKDRGQFLRVARPKVCNQAAAPAEPNKFFDKGQKAGDRSGEHASYFGRQRRFYSGKYSEGNRFIRDNAL